MLGKSFSVVLISATCVSCLNLTTLKTYDAKTCKNEPSCDLVDDPTLPADRRTLRKRPCMCDAFCVVYRDCCTDSKYYNELEQSRPPPFTCQSTYRVYLKTVCPQTWTDEDVKSKCLLSTSTLRSEDTSLIIPVTNTITNITYGNKYCALCHTEQNLRPWTFSPLCGEAPRGILDHLSTPESATLSTAYFISSTPEVVTSTAAQLGAPSLATGLHTFRRIRSSKNLHPSYKGVPKVHSEVGSAYIKALLRYMRRRRRKRDVKIQIDLYKYIKFAKDIWKTAHYDQHSGHFVAKFQDKDMICRVSAKLPTELKPHVRPCVPNIIETCQETSDTDVDRQCRSHTSLVFNRRNNKAYRNKYCAECDGAESNFLTGCPIIVRDDGSPSSVVRLA